MLGTRPASGSSSSSAPDRYPVIQAASPAEAALTRGPGHFALLGADLDGAYDRLLWAGARSRVPPVDAPRAGARMAWVADCEDNLIELITAR